MSGLAVSDWISSVADSVTAVAVATGVWVAYKQLGSWRDEAKVKKAAEVAELVISAANDADAALRFIRSPWGSAPPDGDEDPKSFQWRERLSRMDERRADFDNLRLAQVRAKAYLGMTEVDDAINELFEVRQEVWAALGTLVSGTETDGDKDLRDFYIGLRWKVYGTYSKRDALGELQGKAIQTLENQLYPVMCFEHARKSK